MNKFSRLYSLKKACITNPSETGRTVIQSIGERSLNGDHLRVELSDTVTVTLQ